MTLFPESTYNRFLMQVSDERPCCETNLLNCSWTLVVIIGLAGLSAHPGVAADSTSDAPQATCEREPIIPIQTDEPLNPWKFVIIHHSATSSGSVEGIHAAHRQRRDSQGNPWLGIGYHFVIGNGNGMPDGAIESTFRWRKQIAGAHAGVRSFNDHGIGICLIGNFEEHPPTSAQTKSLRDLLNRLLTTFQLNPESVLTHGDLKSTACPGKLFQLQDVIQVSDAVEQRRQDLPVSRFSPIGPGLMEEISNVASVQRASQFRRPDRGPVPAE